MKRVSPVAFCLLAVALAGCADPTRDKPKATVDDPTPEPARPAAARTFVLTDESTIGFVGSKITGSHDGGFHSFEGEIRVVDGDPLQSSVDVTIDTTSIWANNDRLTEHLKSPDFFEVETYPSAAFTSTQVLRDGDGYRLVGNLTLHGITKSISFPADITIGEDRVTASSEFAIKRFDFDIKFPGKPDDLIRDDVLIKLDLVAVPAVSGETES
jgi:polyisoprenoid-binding protein YceI